jgi:hypothetical protein
MADSYHDIAQALLDRANLRYQSKGTVYDVLYSEQATLDRSRAVSRFPTQDRLTVPDRCVPGAKHPRCTYLVLVDAYRTGGDDHHDNWTLLYRVDLQQFLADKGDAAQTFPEVLVDDNTSQTDERQGGGGEDTVIVWRFDVILANADQLGDPSGNPLVDPAGNALVMPVFGYSRPPLYTTTHPTVTSAILVSETQERSGPVATITRRYAKLPTDTLSSANYKNESVIPPTKFLPSLTITTQEDTRANTAPDTGVSVIGSQIAAIDPSRVKRTTQSASFPAAQILYGSEVDMSTGRSFEITQELVTAGTEGSAVGIGGLYSTVEPLNTAWSIRTTRKSTTLTTRQWDDVINFPWPAVLASVNVQTITNNGFPVQVIVTPLWQNYAYNGPCRATIVESWSLTTPAVGTVTSMVETPIVYQGVFFSVSIPACLHGTITFVESSGTNNPNYDNFSRTQTFNPTNYTLWPSSILGASSVTPYKGGYLQRSTTSYRPGT